jgi:hypothetical protein
MKMPPWIVRLLMLAGLAVAVMRAAPPELELTGDYDDEGTVVTAAPDQPPGVVSLHALFSLEFVPGLARLLHDQTGAVKLHHEGSVLRAEVINREGEAIWRATWKQGEGFAVRDGRAILHFKPGRFGNDEFVLILSTITTHRLLQVEVQRLKPTFFGPVFQPVGTYLFHRM